MSSSSWPPPPPSPGCFSPICGQHDDAADSSFDEGEDEDNLRRFMQTFGSKQDDFCYAGNGDESDSCSDGEGSAGDDIAYLRRLQEQFLPPAVALGSPGTPPILKPLRAFPPLDTDDDEDFETLRAIQRRFAHYGGVTEATNADFSPETSGTFSADTSEQDPHNISLTAAMNEEHQEQSNTGLIQPGADAISVFPKFVKSFTDTPKTLLDNVPEPPYTSLRKRVMNEEHPEEIRSNFNQEDGLYSLSVRQFMSSRFPKSVQNFVHALKKNRSCQRFIREKMMEIEAKIEVNRKLKERIKCLMDFHTACKRKVGRSLCQKRDPRIRLISFRQQKSSSTVKENSKKSSALYFAPAENAQMSNYKMVMGRFPVSLRKRQWSNAEKDKLFDGVKQQCQEMLFLNSMNIGSDFDGLNDSIITSTFDCARHLLTPEILRSFIRLVNWDRLASMYLPRRSGSSCESRWLNHEDPMINCNPWTSLEDKKLLFTVQDRGLYNWIDMASTLGTNRTPFQCLARYQRSLNPHILNREWTREEDSKLCTAVETFGDNSWQIVASHLDGRTSNQCSVRWRNTLLPERKRVGRWSVDEDKRLKVSVILFGAKNWKKIAQFIPGRTQSQCRERWLNCLDPSLNLERWTEEEDAKFLAAIAEHGHRWSKVAACIPGRTDNQCRRRWKVLLPHEVPMLKAAQQLKRTVLISNFVGREGERPAIGPNDFTPVVCLPAPDTENNVGVVKKRERSNPGSNKNASSRNNNLRKARNKFRSSTEEKSADNSIIISMEDAFANLSVVSVETSDFTATGFPKRKRERSFRNKQSRKSRDKSERDGEENSKADGLVNSAKSAHFYLPPVPALPSTADENENIKRKRKRTSRNKQSQKSRDKSERDDEENSKADGLVNSAKSAHFYLPPVPALPSTADENENIKRKRKRTSRISQPKRLKSHKRKRIDDIFASSELSEDALMELPLVHVIKLISRKSRAMHETSKKT
ncbi:uncharacterized protein LOC110103393 isoform X4 [Dendrobium catenatum]|uniref:uncharacterized protein LOC110103393 isoform X4 n=1 Tax=Dendrobium catenatum TaxID=906689 RepID=UPI00109FDF94|nr:uncharacterized protein LOC110103393 isoform X4 [Dendrobium catenatum]